MNFAVKNIYGKTNCNPVSVEVPGSKSITARAMLIAAIADGVSTLYGAQFSDDCRTFLNCLSHLGINHSRDGNTLKIEGCGGRLPKTYAELDVGSAGTAARFLPAFLSLCEGEFLLRCSAQMRTRPVAPLIGALRALGAKFAFLERENEYPFIIYGTANANADIEVDVSKSSQFLSALLLSAPCADRTVKIKVCGKHGRDYVDMTKNVMRSFGVNVTESDASFTVEGRYQPKRYRIEPDVSAACYFYAMNRILGTSVSVNGVMQNSLQGDEKFIKLLQSFDGGKIDASAFSDQALTLAAIAPYFSSPTEICGVAHIRGQECDRIRAIKVNLAAMGVRGEEREDGVKIYPSQPGAAHIDTFGDHRVAMAFALTGLRADGIVIDNAEVCAKTFADYFAVFADVSEKLTK